jgi:hypothetical protein
MKFAIILSTVILLVLISGFGYFAFVDTPVQQQQTRIDIPTERFFHD